MKKLFTISLLTVLFTLSTTFASGFQINEHGARAMGMGGAFTALANDASAVYFNAAGITQLSGMNFSVGSTFIAPSSKFTGPSPYTVETELDTRYFTPINFYFTTKLTDDFYFGFGVNNPFGLGTTWPEDWLGNQLAIDTEVRTFFFNPVIAYKISKNVSVSAGFNFAYGDVKIDRISSASPAPGLLPDARTMMEGDATAIGFTASVLMKTDNHWSLGINFRSESKFEFEGDAVTNPEAYVIPGLGTIPLPGGAISAELTTPMNLTVGLAYEGDDYSLAFDYQYVGWSSYEELAVTFDSWVDPYTGSSTTSAERDYKNSVILRAGCEYNMTSDFDVRAGLIYDINPVKSRLVEPTLPDANRLGLNIGFGYKFTENLSVDLAYLMLLFEDREIDNSVYGFNGKYESDAHLIGLNFNYTL